VSLDHVVNAHRHGLPTDQRDWNLAGRRRREGVSIPIQDCPLCLCSGLSAAQICLGWGHLVLSEECDQQRRGLQQVEGELVDVIGASPPTCPEPLRCGSSPHLVPLLEAESDHLRRPGELEQGPAVIRSDVSLLPPAPVGRGCGDFSD
jgi:hypothetical protein